MPNGDNSINSDGKKCFRALYGFYVKNLIAIHCKKFGTFNKHRQIQYFKRKFSANHPKNRLLIEFLSLYAHLF